VQAEPERPHLAPSEPVATVEEVQPTVEPGELIDKAAVAMDEAQEDTPAEAIVDEGGGIEAALGTQQAESGAEGLAERAAEEGAEVGAEVGEGEPDEGAAAGDEASSERESGGSDDAAAAAIAEAGAADAAAAGEEAPAKTAAEQQDEGDDEAAAGPSGGGAAAGGARAAMEAPERDEHGRLVISIDVATQHALVQLNRLVLGDAEPHANIVMTLDPDNFDTSLGARRASGCLGGSVLEAAVVL
jgi:hypothetical protein